MTNNMFIVGLTGGIGSGKTTISNIFSELGVDVVDTDELAREVVMPGTHCLQAISHHFGAHILLRDGSLDRRKLRDIVFSNREEKNWLESLLHPAIRTLTRERLAAAQSEYAILSSPLLLESPDRSLVSRVLVVDITPELQRQRTAARDNTTEEAVEQIIASQLDRDKRLALADDIIDNSKGKEHAKLQALNLHQSYLQLAGAINR